MIYGHAAGIVIDASALRRLHGSVFLRTVIRLHLREQRPILIPSSALAAAAMTSRLTAGELQLPGITITELTPAVIDGAVENARRVGLQGQFDTAHVLYESVATGGFPVVTGSPDTYRSVLDPPDLEIVP